MKTIATQSDVAVMTSDLPVKAREDIEQPRFSKRETLLTMLGVLMVMLLASLDQIFVSTAMLHMVGDV